MKQANAEVKNRKLFVTLYGAEWEIVIPEGYVLELARKKKIAKGSKKKDNNISSR